MVVHKNSTNKKKSRRTIVTMPNLNMHKKYEVDKCRKTKRIDWFIVQINKRFCLPVFLRILDRSCVPGNRRNATNRINNLQKKFFLVCFIIIIIFIFLLSLIALHCFRFDVWLLKLDLLTNAFDN